MNSALEGRVEDPPGACLQVHADLPGACGYKRGVAGPNALKENGGRFKLKKLSSYTTSQRYYTNAATSTSAPKVHILTIDPMVTYRTLPAAEN